MAANTEFSVANLEFDSIKSNLITFMQGQAVFADYDFTGSNLNVLMDLLSYNTYYNNIYLNHVASEMFLDSAQLRDSVYSIAKSLNYLPRSYRSAVAYINCDLNPTDTTLHSITIPRLTTFTAAVGDNTYSFSTNSDVTVYANTGYTAANLAIYEGEIIQEAFLVSNTASNTQQFFINNFDVDVTSLMVKVRTSNTDSTNSEYTRANSLFGISGSSNVYFVEPSSNGSYKVVFGNNTFGRQLANNNLVELTYRVSSGTDPNGANSFSADSVQGHPVAVSLVNRASNGDKFQDLDDVKFAAPRSLSVQERAVTSDDYATLVTNEFGDISSVYVYGGEEEETPQFGRVIIALRSEAYDVLPTQLKNQVSNFLKPKMPIGMRSTIKDPTFINIVLDVKVKYNRNATPKTPEEIQTLASSSIVTFNTDNLDKFDRTFRKSKLSKEVGNAHLSIESNEVNVKMTKDISPEVDTAFASTLKFNQELKIDNPIDEISQDAFQRYSTPTITSEVFKHDGITGASLRDNSAGVLQVVTVSNTDLTILNKNVGTVDYVKGEVKISGLVINTYASGATSGNIKVYAVPLDPDIVGKNEDVIRIRTSDTTVTVTELRL
jgi:hypothetical protein